MNSIGAATALTTLAAGGTAQARGVDRPLQGKDKDASQEVPASTSRGTFSAKELGEILSALKPMLDTSGSEESNAPFLENILGQLAAKRAAGEEALLVVVGGPKGGGITLVLSPAELEARLASNDPNSMGSMTEDGKAYSFRDMVRGELSKRESGASMTTRDTIASAIADMMAEAAGKERADKGTTEKIRKLSDDAAAAKDGAQAGPKGTVNIVAMPARAPDTSSPAGSSPLLDVSV